jgi:hypothetical protein
MPEAAQFFTFSPGRLNGEMGDDIFQYFTPPPPPRPASEQQQQQSQHDEDETARTSDNPSPLGNFVQNLLTNMLGQNVDISQTNTDSTRPMVFFGNMVDGNVRFQPVPSNGAMPGGMPGGMPEGAEAEGGENNRGNREENRGNNIAR